MSDPPPSKDPVLDKPPTDSDSEASDGSYSPDQASVSDFASSLASEHSGSEIDLAAYLQERDSIPVPKRSEKSSESESEGEEEDNPEPEPMPKKRPRPS